MTSAEIKKHLDAQYIDRDWTQEEIEDARLFIEKQSSIEKIIYSAKLDYIQAYMCQCTSVPMSRLLVGE